MRCLLFIALFTIEALAYGQGFDLRFDLFANGYAQTAFDIERTNEGYCVIGASSDYDSVGVDSFFFHASVLHTFIGATGELVTEIRNWRPYHSAFVGWSNCCDTIPGGGYVVGGSSEDATGFDEVYLMRFDAGGDTLWTRVFGDPNGNRFWIGFQVKRAPNGDFLVVGITDQNGPFNAFVLRTDSSGNELWRQIQVYDSGIEGGLGAIVVANDGDLFTSGTMTLSESNSDHWVQRLSTDGIAQWQVGWGGAWREGSTHISGLGDGHLLVSGGTGYAANLTEQRPYLAKLDSADGSIIWENEYGPVAYSTQFFPAKERPNGDLIACGVSYSGGDQQGLLLRTTSEGDSLWMRSYFYQDTLMQDGTGRFYDVLPTEDGGFIAAGAAYHSATLGYPEGYSQDTWVVKVDSMGCIVPGCDGTGVTEIITNLKDALTVFPNPAHGQVSLRSELPASLRSASLALSIVGTEGRVVRRETWPLARDATLVLDIRDLSPGLYTLHLTDGTTWITGTKLVVE